MRIFIIIATIALMSTSVFAEPTYSSYRQMVKEKSSDIDLMKFELKSINYGMLIANIYATTIKKAPLYCIPTQLDLTDDQLLNIIDKTYKSGRNKSHYNGNTHIGLIMLDGLIETFPCESN